MVFFADNGAPIPESVAFIRGSNYGVNWPLRQGKGTLFEGGVRTPAFIWSPLLRRRGRVTDQLFHSTDWLPTLYEAAGGNLQDLVTEQLDGISQWKHLQDGLNYGLRKEMVLNIDQINHQYSIIYQDTHGNLFKLLGGNVLANTFIGWSPPLGTNALNLSKTPNWKRWTPTSVECNFPVGREVSPCILWQHDCLLDLTNDPCESNNIADNFSSMLHLLQSGLVAYNASSYPAVISGYDPASHPDKWNGWWVPWKDVSPWDNGVTNNPLVPVDSF